MRSRAYGERFWEVETWSSLDTDYDGDDCGILDGKGDFIIEDGLDIADAKLMSAAPELVRVILELLTSRDDCPMCGNPEPSEPCAPTCRLDMALRKAGVR